MHCWQCQLLLHVMAAEAVVLRTVRMGASAVAEARARALVEGLQATDRSIAAQSRRAGHSEREPRRPESAVLIVTSAVTVLSTRRGAPRFRPWKLGRCACRCLLIVGIAKAQRHSRCRSRRDRSVSRGHRVR